MIEIKCHYSIEQGTDEWLRLRLGRYTGTDAALFLAEGKNPEKLGAGLIESFTRKAAEKITGVIEDGYKSYAMKQGNEREDLAFEHYSLMYFEEMEKCGFVSRGEFLGYSPDAFIIDGDFLAEIKCPQPAEYLRLWQAVKNMQNPIQAIGKAHFAQMQWGMWITGKPGCKYIFFNPEFSDKCMGYINVPPCEKTFETFEKKAPLAVAYVKGMVDDFLK